ncbi:unnamed protein product [Polarella glacialis]|uniref:glutathione gamma-glutamylcysteinyltransferase n=1 Tax=Polarella glacialis TaxID=89957 RepID=A0A813LV56_POLGL|nr:unnamed protein product [Polarella glacialis]
MGCFFRLIEQFHTQDEPSFCGLGTLTMVLNAMNVDPGRTWKGPWRWFRETMLDCCEPLERIQLNGITFIPLACLARCNGAFVETHRADESDGDLEAFRRAVCASCCEVTGCAEEEGYKPLKVLVVSYSRKQFGQTGDGHYSPIGGYHAASDKVLVLDVARFKHPPHWVPLVEMWESMRRLDPETGLSRGFMLLSRKLGALCSSWLSLSIRDKTESGAAHPVVGSLVNLPEAFAAALTTWQGDLPRLPADGKLAAAEVLRRAFAFCDSPAMPLSVVCRQPSSAASPEGRPELATGEQAAANEALRQVLHALGQAGAAMDRALSPLPEVPVVLAVDNLRVALLLALDLSLWERALSPGSAPRAAMDVAFMRAQCADLLTAFVKNLFVIAGCAPQESMGADAPAQPEEAGRFVGIDLGVTCVVASSPVTDGSKVTVNTNDVSGLSTPAAVSYDGKLRHIGMDAEGRMMSAPKQTLTYLPLVLTKSSASRAKRYQMLFPMQEDGKLGPVKYDGEEFAVPSCGPLSALLRRLVSYAVGASAQTQPVCIAIHDLMSEDEEAVVRDAIDLAGLKDVASLVRQSDAVVAAFAQSQGSKLLPEGVDERSVAFVDIGVSHGSVFVVRFARKTAEEGASPKEGDATAEFLYQCCEESLGVRTLVEALLEEAKTRIEAKYKCSVNLQSKAGVRLANEATPVDGNSKRLRFAGAGHLSMLPDAEMNLEALAYPLCDFCVTSLPPSD